MKILLIEDEAKIAEFVIKGLSAAGYDVTHVDDGERGLAAVLVGAHDLVILDVMLPKLNGFDLLHQARGAGITTPVIILSAKVDLPDRLMGFEMGADDYLPKPFFVEELVARIKAELLTQVGECMRTSVGIAPNTLLAKLASNMQKPDGLTVIEAHELPQRLYGLKPKAINGIGPRMVQRLERCGIHTMEQLYAAPRELLRTAWGGVAGAEMYDKLRGQWYGPRETVAKSLGHSHVLPPDLRNPAGAFAVLNRLTQKAAMRLRKQNVYATSMSVHVRCRHGYGDNRGLMGDDRAAHVGETQDTAFLLHTLEQLWHSGLHLLPQPVTVGVQLHGLIEAGQHTGDLFGFEEAAADAALDAVAAGTEPSPSGSLSARVAPAKDRRKLMAAIDTLNSKHGKNTVYFASAQAGLDHAPMRIAFNRIPDLESDR